MIAFQTSASTNRPLGCLQFGRHPVVVERGHQDDVVVVVVLSRIGWDARYRRQVLDTLVQSAAGSHSSRVLTGRLDEAPVGAAAPVSASTRSYFSSVVCPSQW